MTSESTKAAKETAPKEYEEDTNMLAEELNVNIKSDTEATKITFIIQDLLKQLGHQTKQCANSLNEPLEQIKKATHILGTLPEKLGSGLDKIIPSLSESLHTKVLMDFDMGFAERANKLQLLENQVNKIVTKLTIYDNAKLKKTLIAFAANTIFLIAIASTVTYCMLSHFPPKIIINNSDTIEIKDSEVKVWSKAATTAKMTKPSKK